jgi:hypothetical protein
MAGRAQRTTGKIEQCGGPLKWKAPAHCAKCGACLEQPEMFAHVPRNHHGVQHGDATVYVRGVHKCPRMWLTRRLMRPDVRPTKHLTDEGRRSRAHHADDRSRLIPPLRDVTKRRRTKDYPTHFGGIAIKKVQRLADVRITRRALTDAERKAVEAYLKLRLSNAGVSENAGAPERPVISDEKRETTIFFIDPATGERTRSVTRIIEEKIRLATVSLDAFIEEIASDEELIEW